MTERQKAKIVARAREWKKFRLRHLMSQSTFAGVLGISRRTVQMIERGRVTPKLLTLERFHNLKAKYAAEKKASKIGLP